MTSFLPNSPAAESWQRLIVNVSESIPESVDGDRRTIHNLGQRLQQVLKKRYRWTVYDAEKYELAYSKIAEYYEQKRTKLDKSHWLTREQAFFLAEPYVEHSVKNMIAQARLAYEHAHNKDALAGFSDSWWYKAEHMSNAVKRWPEFFEQESPRVASVYDLLILFKFGSLNEKLAGEAFNYWRDHQTSSYREMEKYVDDLKDANSSKDSKSFKALQAEAVSRLEKLNRHAENGKREEIQEIIERVKSLRVETKAGLDE